MAKIYALFISFMISNLACVSGYADTALLQKPAAQQFITAMVKDYGFDRQALSLSLQEAVYQPQIIDSMEKPYEKKAWDIYKAIFLTPKRLNAGLAFWQKNKDTLIRAEKEYGVPADIITAIIGVETLYGEYMGNYRVLDALTTLAFYYPKRTPFFTKELQEYLLLCREHQVNPNSYKGSYAGAIGKPQFMPSSYRFYAVDFAGHGRRDLINEDQDVIGSVANYLQKNGWKPNPFVAQMVTLKGTQYKHFEMNTRQANYPLRTLEAAGVTPLHTPPKTAPEKAGLIQLETTTGIEYWLAYPNFYVITRYNTSPQYALAVYLFSQQLRTQWATYQATGAHVNA